MCDEWMPTLRLRLSWDEFQQLPRNPAYKYEYLDGVAWLSPRPRFYHASLDLAAYRPAALLEPSEPVSVRRLRQRDFPQLQGLFAGAFARTQPYASVLERELPQAAERSLLRTRTGGDGPIVRQASFVAHTEDEDRQLVGAIIITLLPLDDPCRGDSYHWREPPPKRCVEEKLGQPHLTWIFVSPWHAGEGIGSTLLQAAVARLRALDFATLYSTFLAGNDSSMLWHWRNGFVLLSQPYSMRRMKQELQSKRSKRRQQ